MKKRLLIFSSILIILVTYILYINYKPCSLSINNQRFVVDVADSVIERQKGLSNTSSLDKNAGKLFVFENSELHGFWMKDMNYPIDIIWFDDAWRVVGISKNTLPESYPTVFYPQSFAKYVLEVNSGWAEKLNIDFETVARVSCKAYLK